MWIELFIKLLFIKYLKKKNQDLSEKRTSKIFILRVPLHKKPKAHIKKELGDTSVGLEQGYKIYSSKIWLL